MAEREERKITQADYKRFFPFPEIREPQEQAINFILNAFKWLRKNQIIHGRKEHR